MRGTGLVSEGSSELNQNMNQALETTAKIKSFVSSVRKQIVKENSITNFSAMDEVRHVIDMLMHKARSKNVRIILSEDSVDMKLNGDPIKFDQIVMNLISNGIDACSINDTDVNDDNKNKEVSVGLRIFDHEYIVEVKDNGSGISPEIMSKIFTPFFTTKPMGEGLGIGLSSTKHMVEKYFNGSISVQSEIDFGSVFTVRVRI
jgi:C4-dicarboxylate-specific signal transduction histidine kinase